MHQTTPNSHYYWQYVEHLDRESFIFLQGLCYQASGIEPPIDPLSKEFATDYGITDPYKVSQKLLGLGLINKQWQIPDKQFKLWIDTLIFPPLGIPPAKLRIYKKVDP